MSEDSGAFRQPLRQRVIGAAGAGAMLGLIGAGLLWGLAAGRGVAVEHALALIDVRLAPPPPPHRKVEPPRPSPAAARPPAPRNLRDTATDVVATPPVVPLPAPTPVVVAPEANVGLAPRTGASDRAGPGEGAGGHGDGSGGGGVGEGDGDSAPVQLRGAPRMSDLPPDLVHDQDADGMIGVVGVRYTVGPDGRVAACRLTRSSGKAALDAIACQVIERRYRFRPKRDASGRPVAADVIDTIGWGVIREDETSPRR